MIIGVGIAEHRGKFNWISWNRENKPTGFDG